MSKYKITTNLTNIKRDKDQGFTYDQELMSIHYPNQELYEVGDWARKNRPIHQKIKRLKDKLRENDTEYAQYRSSEEPEIDRD